jgi:hypothetical protein
VENIRQAWSRSKIYRILVIITALLVLLRPVANYFFYWTDESGVTLPSDFLIYIEAANNFQLRRNLYPAGELPADDMFFQYQPAYALAFTSILWLPDGALLIAFTLLHIAAYGLIYIQWCRIFRELGFDQVNEWMAQTLPVWLIFSAAWYWLDCLNIGIFVALAATLLIEAVMNERLGWAVLWLSLILQTKPTWAFAVAVPLLLGRRRFFFKLVALAAVVYVAIGGMTILAAGPAYGWQQYVGYIQHLGEFRGNWPWRSPDAPCPGENHSITQIVVYLLGVTPTTLQLATGIKWLLLAPLAAFCLLHLVRPVKRVSRDAPELSLGLAFGLYLGSYIWLDMVYEVFLSIVIFVYLVSTLEQLGSKILVWTAFLSYALADLWFAVSTFGPTTADDRNLWNLSNQIPTVMIVVLVLYALLMKQLWGRQRTGWLQSNTSAVG